MIEWIVSSSVLIVMVALLRMLVRRRLPLRVCYALWLAAAVRLLIPVSLFESRVSVQNLLRLWEAHAEAEYSASVRREDDGGKDKNGSREDGGEGREEREESREGREGRKDSREGREDRENGGEDREDREDSREADGAGREQDSLGCVVTEEAAGRAADSGKESGERQEVLGAAGRQTADFGALERDEAGRSFGFEEGVLCQTADSIGGSGERPEPETAAGPGNVPPDRPGITWLWSAPISDAAPGQKSGAAYWGNGTSGQGPDAAGLLSGVWICGMGVCAVLAGVINGRYRKRIFRSRRCLGECGESLLPVYVSAAVRTPCMFGLLHPAVYLTPDAAKEEALRYILCHENTHYRHRDNLWALVRTVCICVHWYNPLVWMAAYLSRQDCELACDEETIARLGRGERIAYGRVLLEFSVQEGTALGGLRLSTTISGRKKQLKERLLMITRKPVKCAGAFAAVLLAAPLMLAVTFTRSRAQERTVSPEEGVSWQERSEAAENVHPDGAGEAPGEGNAQSDGVGGAPGEWNAQSDGVGGAPAGRKALADPEGGRQCVDVGVSQRDGERYVLQIVSEPAGSGVGYHIVGIQLYRGDDTQGEALQSLCPDKVKPLYIMAAGREVCVEQENRVSGGQTDGFSGEQIDWVSGGQTDGLSVEQKDWISYGAEENCSFAKQLQSFDDVPLYAVSRFLTEGNQPAVSDSPDGGLFIADLNFDGYEDFCIQAGAGSANLPYYCYLWNPEKEQYEHSVMIPNVQVDAEAELIVSPTEDGEGIHSVKYYRFDRENRLHLVRYTEENASPDALFPMWDLNYCAWESEYGVEAVDDLDSALCNGGAVSERLVYWGKQALTELYQWSGTRIAEAFFTTSIYGDFYFGQTARDVDASRTYYSRAFGAEAGFQDCIQSISVSTERVVWYSPVIQWNVPEELRDMTDAQVVEWYFGRLPLTVGETAADVEAQGEDMYSIKTESGKYYEIIYNRASREVSAVYGPYSEYYPAG